MICWVICSKSLVLFWHRPGSFKKSRGIQTINHFHLVYVSLGFSLSYLYMLSVYICYVWFFFEELFWVRLVFFFGIHLRMFASSRYLSSCKTNLSSMCCIAMMISITTMIIQIQAIRRNFFLSTFSPWRHEERDTNHKSLCSLYYFDTPNT